MVNNKIKNTATELADILFPEQSDVDYEGDFSSNILNIPPEQRKLYTESSDFTVETLVNKLLNGSIFIPEFQRKYVWSDIQASKLIESLIIQCPIPVIYLNQEKDEKYSVIDGNQRINSLRRYIEGDFSLRGLTAYTELDGLLFSQLDPRIQRHILNRTIRCISILRDTHPQVKFDVFERLNSGAVKLNKQELRHGLYYGNLIKSAKSLVKKTSVTKYILPFDVKNKRMKAEEFILRFWTLSQNFQNYKGSLAASINNYIEVNDKSADIQFLEDIFIETFESVVGAFGEYSFMTFERGKNEEKFHPLKFNAALFDAQMVGFYLIKAKKANFSFKSKEENLDILFDLFKGDKLFIKNISQATGNRGAIEYRIKKIEEIFVR